MSTLLLFAALGIAYGAAYAGLGVGVVTTYRATGVVNLAVGAIAMWAAYVYDEMHTTGRLYLPIVGPWTYIDTGSAKGILVSLVVGVGSSTVLCLALYLLVFRPLRDAPQLAHVAATIGITMMLQSVALLSFGVQQRSVESFYSDATVTIAGQPVPVDQFEALGILLAATLCVTAYLKWTRSGLATLAMSDSPRSVGLFGYSPTSLALTAWGVSGALAGLAGILVAPIVQLSAQNFTLFIVPVLAAALVAKFRSIPLVFVAGVGLGVGQSILGYAKIQPWYPAVLQTGVEDALPFIVILVVLIARKRVISGRETTAAGRLPRVYRPSGWRPTVAVMLVLTVPCLLFLDGTYRFGLYQTLIGALLMLSFVLLTGYGGQISVAQVAVAGLAGLFTTRLAVSLDIPFPLAPGLGVLVAAMLGLLIALPALRAQGIHLLILTLAFAVAAQAVVFGNPQLNPINLAFVPSPKVFGLDFGVRAGKNVATIPFGILVLVVLICSIIVVTNLMRGLTGLRLLAVRSSERVAASVGVGVVETKMVAFAVASVLAGLAGALTVYSLDQFSAVSFDTISVAIPLLAFAFLGGITSVNGALVAATLVPGGIWYVFATDLVPHAGIYYLLVSGLSLVTTAISSPEGMSGTSYEKYGQRWLASHCGPRRSETSGGSVQAAVLRPGRDAPSMLRVEGVTVRYGGVVAVNDASLRVQAGEIVGLIGPNGAGKTSLIDAISGFARYTGDVRVDESSVMGWAPHRISRRGVSRTWQSPDLFSDLTTEQNIAVGMEHGRPIATALADVRNPNRTRLEPSRDLEILASLGLVETASLSSSSLSLGQQKLAGVARAMASSSSILLLDEPAAGLNTHESEKLGRRLRELANNGFGLLLVDHDMDLVFSTCDRIVVLVFGVVIAEGTPSEIRANPAVVEAYLGMALDDDVELGADDAIARAGR